MKPLTLAEAQALPVGARVGWRSFGMDCAADKVGPDAWRPAGSTGGFVPWSDEIIASGVPVFLLEVPHAPAVPESPPPVAGTPPAAGLGGHTPEPWHRVVGRVGNGLTASQDEQIQSWDGIGVLLVQHDGNTDGIANVQRVVDCVNACAGIADPETTVPALLAEVRALRAALRQIIDSSPEYRPTPPDLIAAIEACADCADCRKRNWPPSRLCDSHYRAVSWHDDENTERQNNHASVLREIARAALVAKGGAS